MANPLIDQLRNFIDKLDDTVRTVDKEIDMVENLPFIGSVVKPFGMTLDTVLGIADSLRATIDQLDPLVPPTAAPKK